MINTTNLLGHVMIHFNPNSITFVLSMPIFILHSHTHVPHIPPLPCCTSFHFIRETSSPPNQIMYTTTKQHWPISQHTYMAHTASAAHNIFGTSCLYDSIFLFTPHICSSSPSYPTHICPLPSLSLSHTSKSRLLKH